MKKLFFIKAVQVFSAAAILLFASSCSNGSSSESETEETGSGKTKVTMFVPDYYALSSSSSARVVAPQTKSVRFGYSDRTEFTYLDAVSLSSAQKSSVSEDASAAGVAGFNYTLTFSGIPVGFYNEKTLEIQLLDSNGNAISKGTNSKSVEVATENEAEASFYTIPVSSDAQSGSLESGEMKFLKISLASSENAKISVSAAEDGIFPEIVIFAADGTFVKYIDISKENSNFEIKKAETSAKYYLGVWAKEEAVSSYIIYVEKTSDPNGGTSEKSGSETSSVKAVIDAIGGYFCLNCGKHYDTEKEVSSCAEEENCPGSENLELDFIEEGSYDLSVSAGFTEQDANVSTQVVNNIAVSAKIEENYAGLKLKSKVQSGTIKFKLSKPMKLLVTEIMSGKQKNLYGVSIVSSDGKASCEGEIVSLSEIPTQKKGTDIANKPLVLTAGTYELCAYQSGDSFVKISNLTFSEITE